jgi:hypothetical protein
MPRQKCRDRNHDPSSSWQHTICDCEITDCVPILLRRKPGTVPDAQLYAANFPHQTTPIQCQCFVAAVGTFSLRSRWNPDSPKARLRRKQTGRAVPLCSIRQSLSFCLRKPDGHDLALGFTLGQFRPSGFQCGFCTFGEAQSSYNPELMTKERRHRDGQG